jgi:hypothetical protein
MSDYMTMTTRHQHINTFAKYNNFYGREYVILLHQPREITKLHHCSVECAPDGVDVAMIWKRKQFIIIHTSYTAPPRPECIEREKTRSGCERCGKDDVEIFFLRI